MASFLNDEATARQTARRYGAVAVLYSATVVETKDGRAACFTLLQTEPVLFKTYSSVPLSLPEVQLEEIVTTLRGPNLVAPEKPAEASDARPSRCPRRPNPRTPGRIEGVQSHAGYRPPEANVATYGTKRAIVIGLDRTIDAILPPLRFAASDAGGGEIVLRDASANLNH